jgi:hypothetical protein
MPRGGAVHIINLRRLFRHYGADWDLRVQIDPAEAQGRREKWLRMLETAKARGAIAAAARAARAERARLGGRKPLSPPLKPLALRPPAKAPAEAGGAALAPAPAIATDAAPQEGRPVLPSDRHDAVRLRDRGREGLSR